MLFGFRLILIKLKFLVKLNIVRKFKIILFSLEFDFNFLLEVNEILQFFYQGQIKVKEIFFLIGVRVMDDSQNNLFEIIDEFKRIFFKVLEIFLSLIDLLGSQVRFNVRRIVIDFENKYSDMQGVVEIVGLNLNAVDMERIGKVVNSFFGVLDSVCIIFRVIVF